MTTSDPAALLRQAAGILRAAATVHIAVIVEPPIGRAMADLLDYLVVDCYEVPMEGIALAQAIVDSQETS